jgi:uncharacterized protein
MVHLVGLLFWFLWADARAGTTNPACDAGDAVACRDAGLALRDDPARLAEMWDLYAAACSLGDARGCLEHGWQLVSQRVLSSDIAANRRQAREAWQVACDKGLGPACASLGVIEQEHPAGRSTNDEDVVRWFRQGCDLKSPWSCRLLADMMARGQGVAVDRDGAAALYEGACADGERRACTQLGLLLEGDHEDPEGGARAAELFDQACTQGDAGACGLLAYRALELRLPFRDGDAQRALKDACNRNSSLACGALGHAYVTGEASPKDPIYGMALLSKACTTESGTSCRYASCEKEVPLACRWRAEHLMAGDAGPKDKAQARLLFGQACAAGDLVSCDRD